MNNALINILQVAVVSLPDVRDRREALAILLDSQDDKITGDMASVTLHNPEDPTKPINLPMGVLREITSARNKIWAIKILRDRTGLGLRECKRVIEHPGNDLQSMPF